MGTKLIVQKRGRGSPAYRTPKHRFVSNARYPPRVPARMRAQVVSFVHDPSKDVLLSELYFDNKKNGFLLAAEGTRQDDSIELGAEAELRTGNATTLQRIPDSCAVFNVELEPGDGGRLARSSGSFATIVAHDEDTGKVKVMLPSKKVVELQGNCLATIGVASGGGRTEKPFKTAGKKFHNAKARNKWFPVVRGTKMVPADHPHGGRSFGKSSTVSRHAPPGQKVGHIAASRTGRRRGKMEEDEKAK